MDEQSVKPKRKPRGASQASSGVRRKGKRTAEHPIAALSGIFKDDPLWDEFVEAMQRARTEEDASEDGIGAVVTEPSARYATSSAR